MLLMQKHHFFPLFYGTNMINDDKSFHFIFIPCLWNRGTDAPPPQFPGG